MHEFLMVFRWSLVGLYLGSAAVYAHFFVRCRPGGGRAATALALFTVCAHLGYVIAESVHEGQPVVFRMFGAMGVLALALTLVYLLVEFRSRERTVGVFFLVVSALFMIVSAHGRTGYEPAAVLMENQTVVFHIAPAILGYAAFASAFIFSILYLLLHQSLRKNRFGIIFDRFPPLETLGEMNMRSIKFGLVSMTLAIALGAVFLAKTVEMKNLLDPKILSVAASWAIFLAAWALRRFAGWGSRRIALATLAGFLLLLLSLVVVNPLLTKYHRFV